MDAMMAFDLPRLFSGTEIVTAVKVAAGKEFYKEVVRTVAGSRHVKLGKVSEYRHLHIAVVTGLIYDQFVFVDNPAFGYTRLAVVNHTWPVVTNMAACAHGLVVENLSEFYGKLEKELKKDE